VVLRDSDTRNQRAPAQYRKNHKYKFIAIG
jgi:hypothetical protein